MNHKSIEKLVLFYDEYVEFSWSKDFQLNFWKIKLDEVVKKISEEDLHSFSNESRPLSEGIFGTYDIALDNFSGWLNTRSEIKNITRETVKENKNIFCKK